MIYTYSISQLRELIDWSYFYWAWGIANAGEEEQRNMRKEAESLLDEWDGVYSTKAIFLRLHANSEGDDIVIGDENRTRLPMLRQQKSERSDGVLLCLADFIRPAALGESDEIGVFCTSMPEEVCRKYEADPYMRMLSQTVADRLAEATAEMVNRMMPGIRPAVGYPSMPDMSINFLLDQLLNMKQIGIRLTETGMMQPHASVSGLIFQHPEACYFNISRVGDDQLQDYSHRRNLNIETIKKFIRQ